MTNFEHLLGRKPTVWSHSFDRALGYPMTQLLGDSLKMGVGALALLLG